MNIISQIEHLETAPFGPHHPTEEERENAINGLKLKKTTLAEYLQACHVVFSKALAHKPGLLSNDLYSLETGPHGDSTPTELRAWPDFKQQQAAILDKVRAAIPSDLRVFENLAFLLGMSDRISDHFESDSFTQRKVHDAIETPATLVLKHLIAQNNPGIKPEGEFVLATQPDVIHSVDTTGMGTPEASYAQQRTIVCRASEGELTPVFLTKYMSPDKIPADWFWASLVPMRDYPQWLARSGAEDTHWNACEWHQRADRVLLEAYRAMVGYKLEYGQIITGETLCFLRIDWEEPSVLYFHVTTPGIVMPGDGVKHTLEEELACTAVSQQVAFILRATGVA